VLVFTPRGRNGDLVVSVLARAGIAAHQCPDVRTLCDALADDTSAVIVSEEALGSESLAVLVKTLESQPPWSEVPLLILTGGGATTRGSLAVARALGPRGNFTLLERPVRILTLITAVRAAARARRRQYEVRELIAREQAARAEAERASRLKDEFLATLSHELRTPLNAILGWSQLLERGGVDAESLSEGLSAIARNARVQTQLIEDLLDLSRIVSGKMRLDVRPTAPAQVVAAAVESVLPAAAAKGIAIEADLDGAEGTMIDGDPARLQQVVWNLLTNATKFTPAGGTVRVSLRRAGPHVRITVSDNGQGISADFLPFIFERFRQADGATTRKHGGLGIGLALVKQLVELHGGSVSAESAGPGQGATFVVTLPVQALQDGRAVVDADSSSQRLEADLSGVRVLLVDDELDALAVFKRALEAHRAEVLTAGNAREALELLTKARPHVLVSDIGMPETDGYELMRQVRALAEEQGGRTPAAAVTAFARSEDRRRALMAGFQSHVAKPVESLELVTVVASLAGRVR
jgi:signal transduction histidine kinase/CheY-like chemotaxis protein